MNIIKKFSELFKMLAKKENNPKQLESNRLSIIDTSTLQIDENLTDLEERKYKKLIVEIKKGDISTIITYGNDIAKTINHYMEITRKRINQNIEENEALTRLSSAEEIINQKFKIIFNNAEIDNIIEELRDLSRECEIRVLALRKVGEEELEKSKRKINIFGNKYNLSKVNSINNAISRLSSSIKIISMLIHSIQIEKYNSEIENDAINKYLENNNPEMNKNITNTVLNRTFDELKKSLTIISELSAEPLLFNNKQIDEIDFNEQSIKSKIDIIAIAKKYLDLYVMKNKRDFFKKDGIFNRINNNLDNLWKEIESDYYDCDLWAKKLYCRKFKKQEGYFYPKEVNVIDEKYSERLESIEKVISIFGEEIPEDFKYKFYKTKFYYKALYYETREVDLPNTFNTNLTEEEKYYYIKFLSEIIEKVHIESNDGDLLKFMDKYLSIKDIDQILTDYKKFVALLRIEKYGRDGLFTMIIYDHKYQSNNGDFHKDFECRALDMENEKKLNNIEKDKLYFLRDKATLEQLYGTSDPFGLDILKLWESTDHANRFNYFFGDYNNSRNNNFWEDSPALVFKDDFTTPRSILKKGKLQSLKDEKLKFIAKFSQKINEKIRLESTKTENERLWNSKTIFKGNDKCSLAEFLAGFAYGFEQNYRGNTKEQVMNKILQFHSIRSDENGNIFISQFGEEPQRIKSGDIYQLALLLILHTSLDYYSEYYRDVLQTSKKEKDNRFRIFDKQIIRIYRNLGKKILSKFSGNKIELEDALDIEYINFFENTRRMIRKKVEQDSSKPKTEQLWNTEYLVSPYFKVSLAEFINSFSMNIEKITNGEISKEFVRNKILNYYSIKRDGYLIHFTGEHGEKGKTFDLEKSSFSEINSLYEITKFFTSNLLLTEKELDEKDSDYREIVSILTQFIEDEMLRNEESGRGNKTVVHMNCTCDDKKGYLMDLYNNLSIEGMRNLLKFPKQTIDFISYASKNTDNGTQYSPNLPLVVTIEVITNMKNGKQPQGDYR